MKAYDGIELYNFNETSTRPWGYVKQEVTFGEGAGEQMVEISFLVVPLVFVYNCILGHPTLAALDIVTSTIHLRVKYHGLMGDMITIQADIDNGRMCLKVRGITRK